MTRFSKRRRAEQEQWRRSSLANDEPGKHDGKPYFHILPRGEWELGLYPGIQADGADSLVEHLRQERIRSHTGINNLCSSWVLCANMFFPFRQAEGREILAGFLRRQLGFAIDSCTAVHLEYEHSEAGLKPGALLGEGGGGRGAGQTSPDVAFEVKTPDGLGLILVESKYTEHWFYECSGHKRATKGRIANPDRSRCGAFQRVLDSPGTQCHVHQAWQRRYWEILRPIINRELADSFVYCPAAKGAYQLLRQQALAEALASRSACSLVVSAVAYDAENTDLFKNRGIAGEIVDLRDLWPRLFRGKASFVTFTHQDWVRYVRSAAPETFSAWLAFVSSRYGFD
jgi:hypothetical protein